MELSLAAGSAQTQAAAKRAEQTTEPRHPETVDDPTRRWGSRALLTLIAAVAGVAYGWGINHEPLELYYAAAVHSMAGSWHDFFFGAFDPAGTVTLDKLPGAFWVQALSVRIFGYHTWAIVLPQVTEGVLAVFFLYRAVSRLRGELAGLVAAFIMAISPATVALNRGNISDTAMTLLLVLAANAISAAIVSGRQRPLIGAAIWVGLAFQTKELEAWLVLPALGLAYLIGGPGGMSCRIRQAAVGLFVALVVSLSWMTIVTLTPSSHRPYVDGSQHNSVFEQVFDYNGFGRVGAQATPLQLLAKQAPGSVLNELTSEGSAPSWDRLAKGDYGRDTGWLLPSAIIVGLGGLFTRRRSYFVLWMGWLVVLVVVFSAATSINAYYTAALSPPIAAILGSGIAGLWASRKEAASVLTRRLAVAALMVAGTAGYGIWLTEADGASAPSWLWPLAAAIGALAVGLLVASLVLSPCETLFATALVAGTAAILVIPSVASVLVITKAQGTPFESAKETKASETLTSGESLTGSTIRLLEKAEGHAPYLMAIFTSAAASPFILASNKEVLPIGGFSGTIPEPPVNQLKEMIQTGKFHLVLAFGHAQNSSLAWIASHCLHAGPAYFCTPANASTMKR